MIQAIKEYFALMSYGRHNRAFTLGYGNGEGEWDGYDCYDVVKLDRTEDGNFEGTIVSDDEYRTRFDFESAEDLFNQLIDRYEDYEMIRIDDC